MWNEAEGNPLYLMYTVKNHKLLKTGCKHENKWPDTDTVQYEMATVRHNSSFLGQFVRQHKAACECDYLAIGVLKLYDMIIKILA